MKIVYHSTDVKKLCGVKMKSIIFSSIILLSVSVFSEIEACRCLYQHPQAHFCESDWVIIATPVKETLQMSNDYIGFRIYDLIAITELKTNDKVKQILRNKKLYTAQHGATCGRFLELNVPYVISGHLNENKTEMHISSCGYGEQLKDVPANVLTGFKKIFKCGCKCNICRSGANCPEQLKQCIWDPDNNTFQTKQMMCYPVANNICSWQTIKKKLKC